MNSLFRLAEIVVSTAGRDKGKYYLVVRLSSGKYVQVADGSKKKIECPKLKNVKHLESTGIVVAELSIWLSGKKRIRNEDIKKIIQDYEKNEEAN